MLVSYSARNSGLKFSLKLHLHEIYFHRNKQPYFVDVYLMPDVHIYIYILRYLLVHTNARMHTHPFVYNLQGNMLALYIY